MSKTVIIVAAAVLAGVVYVEVRLAATSPAAVAPIRPPDTAAIEARLDRLEAMVAKLRSAPPAGFPSGAAVDPARPGADGTAAEPAPPVTPEREREVRDFIARIEAGEVAGEEMNHLWNLLSGTDFHDEALAALVKNARAHPKDADAQYGVGIGAISKLVSGRVSFAEQGQLSMLADAAFTKALEIDDHHFGARFSKAVSYTYWPEAMGKGPAAIAEFETLRQQCARDASIPMLDQVYTNLGIQYRKIGNKEKSREALQEGLLLFPDSEAIREQLKALGD
jgi:tetratricopeptide (TPR) repeat protein